VSITDADVQHVESQSFVHLERIVGQARSFAHSRAGVDWLALGGRILLVWMPAFALVATSKPPLTAVATASVVTALWLVALRAAFANYFTLGPVVASAVGTVTGLVAVSALDLWAPRTDFGIAGLAETAAAVFVLSAAWEYAVRSIVKRRVLIVGTGGCASDVMEELTGDARTPFRVVGVVSEPEGSPLPVSDEHAAEELSRIVRAHRPDIIILADERAGGWAVEPLLKLAPLGFRIVGVSHFFEHALGRVPLRHLTPTWFMSMLHLRQKLYSRVAKRTFDLVVASVGLLLVAPLLPVLVLLVRTTRGSIIYRQTRLGEGARRFTMYKFRTMRSDAEGPGMPMFAQERDPRATRTGRILRQTHLDEIPQLWNVLKGDMSIVGPRPERPEFVEMLEREVPFWTRRLLIKPGITGWAQLRSNYAFDADSTAEKLSYDLWYLRNRNVVIDLAICVQTVAALLLRRGR
jgi:exopolysaccharide biosynthesis polyprenyl glycosylphosphotransferase